jgi:hypothetical protein
VSLCNADVDECVGEGMQLRTGGEIKRKIEVSGSGRTRRQGGMELCVSRLEV